MQHDDLLAPDLTEWQRRPPQPLETPFDLSPRAYLPGTGVIAHVVVRWWQGKQFRTPSAFRTTCVCYASDVFRQVKKLLNQKAASFEHTNIYRVSVAAAPLATWVKANIK